ncbi:MAG: hypothetical protein ACLPVY_17680 [Acidimicrobiia bacterium]
MRDRGAPPRLVVPEGLIVDEHVRERLERQLAFVPDAVAGVGAEIAELESGASYRVHTEWLSLAATGLRPASSTLIRGAVLLRPDVEFAVREGSVDVEAGSVVVDPGAQVHDPHRPIGPLEPASRQGRPPFPRRPVAVFLGCEPVVDADWLRRLVNRLVRHDVEARIATSAPVYAGGSPGAHLTRPCLAGEATIRALTPDVVVTLDAQAAANIDTWCRGDRSTVVVAFDPTLSEPMELVSWRIGQAAGRLRARIGPWVDVAAFASLVGRLCAGPHPIPPSDRTETPDRKTSVHEHWTNRDAAQTGHRCVVVTGTLDRAAAARIEGLVDNLEAAGVPVTVGRHPGGDDFASDVRAAAHQAGLLVVAGVAPTPDVDALISARRVAGLSTAVDLGLADLDAATGRVLTSAAATLCQACDLVFSPAGTLHTAGDAAGRRALVVPTLLTRARAAALRDARASADPADLAGLLVIGWRVGASANRTVYAAAVADGIARILTEHRDRVEIVGDVDDIPAELRGHDRVSVVPDADLDPETIAGWAVHVWTPTLSGAEIVDDARLFDEASCAGVPTVMPADACTGVDGFVSPNVLVQSVDRADDWYDALHHVLDDTGRRTRRGHEAARRADALDGPAAAKAVVSRVMGLARYQVERR